MWWLNRGGRRPGDGGGRMTELGRGECLCTFGVVGGGGVAMGWRWGGVCRPCPLFGREVVEVPPAVVGVGV